METTFRLQLSGWHSAYSGHPHKRGNIHTSRASKRPKANVKGHGIKLPALGLHPLNLLHSTLEREPKQLPPAVHPGLLDLHTPPSMETLRGKILAKLVIRHSIIKSAQRSRKVNATLRLDLNLSAKRGSELHLDLADLQTGMSGPVTALSILAHSLGNTV